MSVGKTLTNVSKREKEEALEKFRRLIFQQAWKYHRRSGVPYEEILSEGYLCFCEALNRYQPERGAFSTFLWTSLSNSLNDFISRWHKLTRDESLPTHVICSEGSHCTLPDNQLHYQDLYKSLSSEAQAIIDIVINSPQDFLHNLPSTKHQLTPKSVRGALFRHLRRQAWSWPRIWKGMREIKEVIR